MPLVERHGHRYEVGWMTARAGDLQVARKAIRELDAAEFDRYDNPFESKFALRDKQNMPPPIDNVVALLEKECDRARRLFGLKELEWDKDRHYAGVFKYVPGDHLGLHVDAGIHPKNGKRKHVTAVLYLSDVDGADLELWKGESCMRESPVIGQRIASLRPNFGRLVLFENNDTAWHSMAPYSGKSTRLVATVSFLSDGVRAFANQRQRAYFVPLPGEEWSAERYELRDRRADPERYAETYRTDPAPARRM